MNIIIGLCLIIALLIAIIICQALQKAYKDGQNKALQILLDAQATVIQSKNIINTGQREGIEELQKALKEGKRSNK